MPARLLFPTEVRRGVRVIDGVTFDYVLFLTPHRLSPEDHALIIDILTGGKHLGLARELIEDRLRGREYSAVGKVTNRDAPDSATGSLSYQDYCEEGAPQLWMNDLCRYRDVTAPRPTRSPVAILIDLFEGLGREFKIPAIHLAVNKEDKDHPDIYVGYGFASVGDDLAVEKAVDVKSEPGRHRRTTRRRRAH